MADDEIKASIKLAEGYRDSVYLDTMGVPTIGFGHALQKGSKIPKAAIDIIFEADYKQAATDYLKLGLSLDPIRRSAIIDLLFNMGLSRVIRFTNFIAALKAQDWSLAALELMDSNYARQLPFRAGKNRDKILKGENRE